MSKNFPFSKFSKNVYSQNGEDHIILELFKRLEISDFKSLYCCEFGAWDGSYLSNTFNLIEKGASAILIEGCPTRFDDLSRLAKRFKKVTAIQAYVSHNREDNNSLDKILSKTEIPKDFDLLYEAYDSEAEFGLFKKSFYISDSEIVRWKCYQNGLLVKGDTNSLHEHLKKKYNIIYLLTHPDFYFSDHVYED